MDIMNVYDCKLVYLDSLEVDNDSGSDLSEQIRNYVKEESSTVNLILDMTDVEGISSSGIGLLISLSNYITQKKGFLKIINLKSKIFEVLKMAKLDKIFDLSMKV